MRGMSKARRVAAGAGVLLSLNACGGGAKRAESPGTCPDGTMLSGDTCVPDTAGAPKATAVEESPKSNAQTAAAPAGPAGAAGDNPSGGPSYDKEAVDAQLKRAAKQVQANCGSASDEEGNKTGPWGSTTATIVLGRNGHVQDVTLPAPYAGKPVGDCVVNSFKKIQYPPYAASGDQSVTWDVKIADPKGK